MARDWTTASSHGCDRSRQPLARQRSYRQAPVTSQLGTALPRLTRGAGASGGAGGGCDADHRLVVHNLDAADPVDPELDQAVLHEGPEQQRHLQQPLLAVEGVVGDVGLGQHRACREGRRTL